MSKIFLYITIYQKQIFPLVEQLCQIPWLAAQLNVFQYLLFIQHLSAETQSIEIHYEGWSQRGKILFQIASTKGIAFSSDEDSRWWQAILCMTVRNVEGCFLLQQEGLFIDFQMENTYNFFD